MTRRGVGRHGEGHISSAFGGPMEGQCQGTRGGQHFPARVPWLAPGEGRRRLPRKGAPPLLPLLLLLLACWACAWSPAPASAQENASSLSPNANDPLASEGFASVRQWARQFRGRIPGSRLRTSEDVARVRDSLACLASRGQWELNPEPRRLPWPPGLGHCDTRWMKSHPNSGLAGPAANRVDNASQWNVRTSLKYEWRPSEECGHWQPFDPEYFCALVRALGGALLIAGDSLSGSHMESIHNSLQRDGRRVVDYFYTPLVCRRWEEKQEMEASRHLCQAVGICKVPIIRVRNDRLTLLEHAPHAEHFNGPHGERSAEYFLPWLSLIRTWGAKAVLLNRGAHFTATPQFAEELELTILMLREKHPDLLILYRSSVAGHEGCETMEVPLEKPQDRASLPFHWGDFHEQNGIAKRIVEKYGGVFLDIEPMTELRGDGHRGHVYTMEGWRHDCLHYCSPGPVDEWTRLLQNSLSRLV